MIPTGALARAAGDVAGMPSSSDFNDADQEWHYALSWMAVDYLCATYGEPKMWELMNAFHNGWPGHEGHRPGRRTRARARAGRLRAGHPRRRPDPRHLRVIPGAAVSLVDQ